MATALSANRTTHHGLKPFDHAAEWARRARVERLWRRSKEEEREEKGLRATLNRVIAQIEPVF